MGWTAIKLRRISSSPADVVGRMAVMAAQNITKGPSRWDIMLSFFERKELTFTLEDGTVVTMEHITAMMNMRGCEPLVGDFILGETGSDIAECYLLRGPVRDTYQDAFIEYRVRSRTGLCAVVSDADADWLLPSLWSKIMRVDGNYDHR